LEEDAPTQEEPPQEIVMRSDETVPSGEEVKRIDLSKAGCRRKRKDLFKKDVYKNVDLNALNDYMTSDNFLVQKAQQVPGLVFETPVIDVPFWRQQQIQDEQARPPRQTPKPSKAQKPQKPQPMTQKTAKEQNQ